MRILLIGASLPDIIEGGWDYIDAALLQRLYRLDTPLLSPLVIRHDTAGMAADYIQKFMGNFLHDLGRTHYFTHPLADARDPNSLIALLPRTDGKYREVGNWLLERAQEEGWK